MTTLSIYESRTLTVTTGCTQLPVLGIVIMVCASVVQCISSTVYNSMQWTPGNCIYTVLLYYMLLNTLPYTVYTAATVINSRTHDVIKLLHIHQVYHVVRNPG